MARKGGDALSSLAFTGIHVDRASHLVFRLKIRIIEIVSSDLTDTATGRNYTMNFNEAIARDSRGEVRPPRARTLRAGPTSHSAPAGRSALRRRHRASVESRFMSICRSH